MSCSATRILRSWHPIRRTTRDYVAAVREEYAQVPEEEFLAGRLAVLTELADREIFRTAKGRQLTDAARTNLGSGDQCAQTIASESLWKDRKCDLRAPHRPPIVSR